MLTEWTIRNFKSLSSTTRPFKLSNLNLVCGANSSGKSSIIQSILMTSQTLGSPATHRTLILNGELTKLGYPIDIAHLGDLTKPVEIGFHFSYTDTEDESGTEDLNSSDQREAEFDAKFLMAGDGTPKMLLTDSRLVTWNSEICLCPAAPQDSPSQKMMNVDWIIPSDLRQVISIGEYDFRIVQYTTRDRSVLSPTLEPIGASLTHFLPSMMLASFNAAEHYIRSSLREVALRIRLAEVSSKRVQNTHLDFRSPMGRRLEEVLSRFLDDLVHKKRLGASIQDYAYVKLALSQSRDIEEWLDRVRQRTSPSLRKELSENLEVYTIRSEWKGTLDNDGPRGIRVNPFAPDIVSATNNIVHFLVRRLRYLGPLRDDPKMIYGLPPIPESKDVGTKGEFTAAILERHGLDEVYCPLPPNDRSPDGLPSARLMRLLDAVVLWLKHMGMVENITTIDRGKMGVELSVQSSGFNHGLDLMNVGVGVSQVLPLLTMCLLAPKDSLILLEQPELHLHPKVQSILGDFFLGITALGKQCIIETHSERIINRIRRRIAEDQTNETMKLARIFFAEKQTSATSITTVEPNEFGAIPEWPKGFFDEGPDESQRIVEAATAKRQMQLARLRNSKKSM